MRDRIATQPRRLSLAGLFARLRRRPVGESGEAKAKRTGKAARRQIVIWAIVIGVLFGLFDIAMPIEDTVRAARNQVRLHPADQKTVVVMVDDHTLNELGVSDPKRSDDAKVIDRLFALGANRVFFDRAFADTTVPEEDSQLVDAFKRHRGRVFVGAVADIPQPDGTFVSIKPNAYFRPHVNLVVLDAYSSALGTSSMVPAGSVIDGVFTPAMSARIAGVEGLKGEKRVDYSIDFRTIPLLNYIDILRGTAAPEAIQGRDVIIAPSSRLTEDFHPVPFRAIAPGAVHQALAAQTLRDGPPINLAWYPGIIFAMIALLLQLRRNVPSAAFFTTALAVLILVPLPLDAASISVDIVPAAVAIGIAWYRLYRLASETYRGTTGLQRIETLHDAGVAPNMDVIALKIRNFATISAVLTRDEIDQLLIKAQAMLRVMDPDAQFSFDRDTFVWLRPGAPQDELENHVRGLHALFRTSIAVGAHAPDVASAIGIDTIRDASVRERTENAIQSAEDAAHANRIFVVNEPELAADRAWRLQILSELEQAIVTNQIEVVFQPKVSLTDGGIIGAEALMRWDHSERGRIDPSVVVASAEEHNRVDMITQFVLARALDDARRALVIDPHFKVAVNISALDLRDPSFVAKVERLVAKYRFPIGNLVLEITETAPIENDPTVALNFARLKRLGVRLSVDDFGIGHASLHYLRQIPADEVKIDRSFVVGMEDSGEDRALVRTAIDMIHSLDRIAVAEGVENAATVALLQEMGCDVGQGYFFHRPISMEAMLARMIGSARAA